MVIAYLIACLFVVGLLSWLWKTDRDPLIYLVPPALAFSPLVRYAGETLSWPGAWLSVRKALVVTMGLSLAFRFLKGDYAWRRIPGMAVIAPYLVWVVASVLWSIMGPFNGDTAQILDEFVDWAAPIALFLCLAASPSSKRRIAEAGSVMALTVVLVAMYCGLQLLVVVGHREFVPTPIVDLTLQGQQEFWWGSFRLYGPFASLGPNALGMFLLFPAAYASSRVFDTSGGTRLGWALIVIAATAVIVGTYSRAAQLGLMLIVVVLPLMRRSTSGIVLVCLSILLVMGALVETTVGQHFRSLYGAGSGVDPDVGYRFQVWRAILSQVANHPLGFGFDGWSRASSHLVIAGLATLPGVSQPGAGQWMRELADRGVAGVFLLGLMMAGLTALTFRWARRGPQHAVRTTLLMAAAAGFFAWSVAFVSDDHLMLNAVAGMFWYVVGITLAAIRDDFGPSIKAPRPSGSPGGNAAARAVDRVAPQLQILPALEAVSLNTPS